MTSTSPVATARGLRLLWGSQPVLAYCVGRAVLLGDGCQKEDNPQNVVYWAGADIQ